MAGGRDKREKKKPRVGVAVLVIRDGEVLIGQRRAGNGPGTWSVPGGLIDFGESFEECAAREVREETGVELRRSTLITANNDVMPQYDDHSITIWMYATEWSGEPRNASPEEHATWEWRAWDDLPRPLYPSLANFIATGWTPDTVGREAAREPA